jgi:hypothetical protein
LAQVVGQVGEGGGDLGAGLVGRVLVKSEDPMSSWLGKTLKIGDEFGVETAEFFAADGFVLADSGVYPI